VTTAGPGSAPDSVPEPVPGESEFLDLEDLVVLMRRLGAGPVRDVGLLEAACARPRASVLGADAYPTLAGKAAALLHSIVANHALVDGNKRLGWLATVVFLDLNGSAVTLDDEAAFRLVMAVAEGRLDVDAIADVLSAAIVAATTS
jgi:death on curing protein